MNFLLVKKSGNKKTGKIPTTISSQTTCPSTCPLKNSGCYAELGHLAMHWNRISSKNDYTFVNMLDDIKQFKDGQLWRHNVAGDLKPYAKYKNRIVKSSLEALVKANTGKRGFTYTHYPVLTHKDARWNRELIAKANKDGFTINLSADNSTHADKLAELGIAPIVTILPSHYIDRKTTKTPAGRKILVCPATNTEGVTCKTCGLCQVANRKTIIGFPAHGSRTRMVNRMLASMENANEKSSDSSVQRMC